MRSLLVVVSTPSLAFSPRVVEVHEPVCVQAFRAELAIEGFDEGVVGRFVRAGEVQGDTTPVCPEIEVARNELRPLIYPDRLGEPELPADVFDDLDNIDPASNMPKTRQSLQLHARPSKPKRSES